MANRTRPNQILFFVSDDEKRIIKAKMAQLGTKNMGAYLRKMAIDGYIIKVDYTQQKKLAAAVSRVASNINQICRRINSTGHSYQRCIVHMVRNTLKYVADKDRKNFANDLKTIYHAPDEETAHRNMLTVSEKWDKKYPGAMARWEANWNVISPMFKFSETVRKVIYTTNAIESLNSGYRRRNRGRSVFPDSRALPQSTLSCHAMI